MLSLDNWQKEVLATEGNIVLRSGRQVGKSTVISIKAGDYAAKNKDKTILVIASVERQAQLLFEKILSYIIEKYKPYIKKGGDRPTKHKIMLNNGSTIYCLPTGLSGYGIRGYTVDLLIADEAAFIPEDVWTAVTPMIATRISQGAKIILLSTPFGRQGYFYRCFQDETFTTFHVSSEDCSRMDKDYLKREKEMMTKVQYAQEYLGEFIDEARQFFSDKLIKAVMTRMRGMTHIGGDLYLGVDIARMGEDETTFEILDKAGGNLVQIDNITRREILTTECTREILRLEKEYNFKKIFLDDGGLGVGVFDQLMEEDDVRRKVVPINNARRSLDNQDKVKKKLMKEDLYNNLLNLMERGKIALLDDPEIFESLKSVQYEYLDGKLKIYGKYTHIAEGLIRAAWCMKDKTLNIYCY